MADASVIKEFLVKLGFRTDTDALKKFDDGIKAATKTVVLFGEALAATAISVAVGVEKFASNLEQLYFASQKTGASISQLRAFERAAQDFGLSTGSATAALEGLQHVFRSQPESAWGAMQSLFPGLVIRDANGKLRNTNDMMVDIGKIMKEMPSWKATQFGAQFGINEDFVRFLRGTNDLKTLLETYRNSDLDDAAIHAHEFMMQLRALGDQLLIFSSQIETALVQEFGVNVKDVTTWLKEHGPELATHIVKAIHAILDELEHLYKELKPAFEWLYDQFKAMDTATDGWSTKVLFLIAVLGRLGGASIIGGIAALTTALGGAAAAAAGAGVGLGYFFDKYFPNNPLAKFGHGIADAIQYANEQAGWGGPKHSPSAVRSPGTGKMTVQAAMAYLMQLGLSGDQAAGMAANFQAESGMDPRAKSGSHFGLAQWDSSRQADFAKWAGFDIHDARATAQKQMAFALHEMFYGNEMIAGDMMMAVKNAAQAGYVASHYYERHGSEAEDNRRAAAAAGFSQNVTINVSGVNDPKAAADEIVNRLHQSNQRTMRNFAVGVQ